MTERPTQMDVQSSVEVVNILGRSIGIVGVRGAVTAEQLVIDDSVILPPSPEIEEHNEQAQSALGDEAPQLVITHNKEIEYSNDAVRFERKSTAAKLLLINTLLAQPGASFKIEDLLRAFPSNIKGAISDLNSKFNDPPLLAIERSGKKFLQVGLHPNVVVLDKRKNPEEATTIAQVNAQEVIEEEIHLNDPTSWELYGETSGFVSESALQTALAEEKVVEFIDVDIINALTKQYVSQRRNNAVPNTISIINNTDIQINSQPFPTGPMPRRLLNRLMASYMSQPKSIEQLFDVKTQADMKKAEKFLLTLQHTGWLEGIKKDGKKKVRLAPAIFTDNRISK